MKQTLSFIQSKLPQWELELLLRRAATEAVVTCRSNHLLSKRIHSVFGQLLRRRCPAAQVDWSEVGRIVAESVDQKNQAVA